MVIMKLGRCDMTTAMTLTGCLSGSCNELIVEQPFHLPQPRAREERGGHYAHLQHEIDRAASVLRHLLQVPVPSRPNWDIAGLCHPCHELAGDFYDFIDLDGRIGIALGDVSGKGFGASLLMASLRASLRAHLADLDNIDDVVGHVNHDLVRDTRDHEFATLFLGVLDLHTSRMTYCSAGHEPAMLLSSNHCRSLDAGGMALGIVDNQVFPTGEVSLAPGEMLAVFSDGLTEARDENERVFGRERIQKILLSNLRQESSHACDSLLNGINWFIGDAPSTDDTTVVVVRAI
jgi:serine phosphatase RsbU (regulator of sigma subunit)